MAVKNRLIWRTRDDDGIPRAYGNFRDYADVGGKRLEALIPEKQLRATPDPAVAEILLGEKLAAYERKRHGIVLKEDADLAKGNDVLLRQFAADHLVALANEGNTTDDWLEKLQLRLERAVGFFGDGATLTAVTPSRLTEYIQHLRTLRTRRKDANGRRRAMSNGTLLHHLNALSGMFSRAEADGLVLVNPVHKMYNKPEKNSEEPHWLEVPEAAAFLEAAFDDREEMGDKTLPFTYEVIATLLLTGGREREVYGLEWTDISFTRETLRFRKNEWRDLKTKKSSRVIPLWPQLAEILTAYRERVPPTTKLVFPVYRNGGVHILRDLRNPLDRIAERLGYSEGYVRTKDFRHTYCAARLQTLDNDAPVSPYTVAQEMGHGGMSMVNQVYGHLGKIRHRSKVVEYRR